MCVSTNTGGTMQKEHDDIVIFKKILFGKFINESFLK